LLDRGAAINPTGGDQGNALMAASYEGHEEVVRLLLDRGTVTAGRICGNALEAAPLNGHEPGV